MNGEKKEGKEHQSEANFSQIKVIQQEFASEYICDYGESIFHFYQVEFLE